MMTESDLDRIIKTWATSYNEEVLQYAQPAAVNDSEVNFIMVCCCPKKNLIRLKIFSSYFLTKNLFLIFSNQ